MFDSADAVDPEMACSTSSPWLDSKDATDQCGNRCASMMPIAAAVRHAALVDECIRVGYSFAFETFDVLFVTSFMSVFNRVMVNVIGDGWWCSRSRIVKS